MCGQQWCISLAQRCERYKLLFQDFSAAGSGTTQALLDLAYVNDGIYQRRC